MALAVDACCIDTYLLTTYLLFNEEELDVRMI